MGQEAGNRVSGVLGEEPEEIFREGVEGRKRETGRPEGKMGLRRNKNSRRGPKPERGGKTEEGKNQARGFIVSANFTRPMKEKEGLPSSSGGTRSVEYMWVFSYRTRSDPSRIRSRRQILNSPL